MTKEKRIAIIIVALVALGLAARESFGQYMRYTRPVANSACANGQCPTAPVKSAPAPSAKAADTAKSDATEKETKIVEPAAAEPGVQPNDAQPTSDDALPNAPEPESDAEEQEWTTPNITDDASANGAAGAIALVYSSTAQLNDEIVTFAARRAREPVAEDEELDPDTPIASIRAVGSRLKELTADIQEQQKKIAAISVATAVSTPPSSTPLRNCEKATREFRKARAPTG